MPWLPVQLKPILINNPNSDQQPDSALSSCRIVLNVGIFLITVNPVNDLNQL